jgi:hypothetical protein
MKKNTELFIEKSNWHDRECMVVGNGLIRLVALTGGGHIAEFRFEPSSGNSTMSPLWQPPWKTIDPQDYRLDKHANEYGPTMEGKLLSGISGHNICLDYFGSPSAEEAACGLSQHGEAASRKWSVANRRVGRREVNVRLAVKLPEAGLQFNREIGLRQGESVAYFRETVVNERKTDHFFHWVQHITLGPPFLIGRSSRISVSGSRGLTFPHGYDEGKVMLASGRRFRWPAAPLAAKGKADLTRPFSYPGKGYVVGVQVDPRKDLGFISAFNQKECLLVGYCFSRSDFPWVTLWEENLAIEAIPWNRKTQALGLEVGTTPLPVPRRENFLAGGPLFGTPTVAMVPALGKKHVRYLSFLVKVPPTFPGLSDIKVEKGRLLLFGRKLRSPLQVEASRCAEILAH